MAHARRNQRCAIFTGDLFSDEVLADGTTTYKALRDLGDVVWVPELGLYVVARYHDVVAGLRAHDVLISGKGVSVNHAANGADASTGTSTLTTDGERHHALKRLEMRPLLPASLKALRDRIYALADAKVAEFVGAEPFEAITQLAAYLPTVVVAELVGIKNLGAETMLEWSKAVFDAFGPIVQPAHRRSIPHD